MPKQSHTYVPRLPRLRALTSPRKAGLRAGRRNAFMHEACSLRQALRRAGTLPLIARNDEVKAFNAFVLLSFKYRFSFL